MTPRGQRLELSIAEHNLFLALAAFGLSRPLFGARVLPVGTLYDPFILRGLDLLNYACYQDARFMLLATPSGITLGPEVGAHQSINTPLIDMSQSELIGFELAFADELALLMRWGFQHMQVPDGGSVYFRLSTRQVAQPPRMLDAPTRQSVRDGAYWLRAPDPSARRQALRTERRPAQPVSRLCPGHGRDHRRRRQGLRAEPVRLTYARISTGGEQPDDKAQHPHSGAMTASSARSETSMAPAATATSRLSIQSRIVHTATFTATGLRHMRPTTIRITSTTEQGSRQRTYTTGDLL